MNIDFNAAQALIVPNATVFEPFQRPSNYQTPVETMSQMTEWVLPLHTNAMGMLFGGILVSWIDIAGVAAAQRYARSRVVTLCIDRLQFMRPIRVGCLVLLRADVTCAGRTSMEVEVVVDAEDPMSGNIERSAKGYLTYVALDKDGKTIPVPPFTPKTEDGMRRFKEAEKRKAQRMEWG